MLFAQIEFNGKNQNYELRSRTKEFRSYAFMREFIIAKITLGRRHSEPELHNS